MWIDLDDEESKAILIEMTDIEGKPTAKQKQLYLPSTSTAKKQATGQEKNRLTTFAYEIRTAPNNTTMLENLLCKISPETTNDFKFFLYGLDTITKKETMREIIIQQTNSSTKQKASQSSA